ncbi:N-lysine methyltransferase SMYD2-A-like isoform X7 [Penaeus monodon]|uniref:N-lysine methyltransferase SMYD2-A-like isoform X7 n=1 Tax=Penaeus monodon TaxID=6687 RepID=UPI0018A6DC8F|nr:N-lysine methyltransferase SMYD2-A-like isoform X7 [Penaeus monodon]
MRDIISVRALSALQKKRRLVKRGDEILTSKPFCFVLENSVIGQYCETCLATARKERLLSRCKGCWRAWYCSDICRDLGETQHRHECQLFRDRPDYRPKDFARFLARLIRKLKEGGEDVVERIDARRSRRFRDLMSHSKEIEKDQKRLDYLAEMMPDLQVLLGKSNIPEREELIQIFGKVHISYLDTMNSREHRRTFLQDSYYFACDCRLCRDEEHARTASSIRCRSKACGTPVHVDESGTGWVDPCGACGFCKFPRGVAYEYIEVAEYTRAELADLDEENPSLEVWRDVTEAQGALLHPLNLWRSKSLEALVTASVNMRQWSAALAPARENEAAIRHYYGPKHPYVGLYLMKLAKIELNNMEWHPALEHLQEAEEILEAGLGSNHPLVFVDLTWLLIQASEECRVDIQRSLMYGRAQATSAAGRSLAANRGRS